MTRADDTAPMARPGSPARARPARSRLRRPLARPSGARIGKWVVARMYVAGGLLSLALLAMGYRAYALQLADAGRYRKLAERQHLRMVEVPAPRGAILDARGRELAGTADSYSAFANPRQVRGVARTAEAIASVLDLDVRVVEARLSTRQHFVWLDRQITDRKAAALRALDLPGVELTREPRRYYPGKELAGSVLGFAGIDGDGLEGVELSMDELLAGERARFEALRDASGRVMMAEGVEAARPGATVWLTIDRAIQYIAEQALRDAVAASQAKSGMLVVLDVKTGEVLAMANWPTYDPNAPGAARGHARNRCVTDAFEIGSIMKVFTVSAALDAGVIDTAEYIDVERGQLRIGRKIIRDTYRDYKLTLGGIIRRSSNVGAVKVARRLGKAGMHGALERFGFNRKTGIELPGERAGVLRDHRKWGDIALASIAFGYGMTATALQVAAGFAAIGDRGVYHEPRIIKRVRDGDGDVVYEHRTEGRRVIGERTAAAMLPMLASVFDKGDMGGTARGLQVRGFRAGGKTGTARKVDPRTLQYSKELYLASFAGLAPIEDPRIAVAVVIDEPRGEDYYGGKVAGPAFVRVVEETLRYLGVPSAGGAGQPDAEADAAAGAEVERAAPGPVPGPARMVEAIDDAPGELPEGLAVRVPDFSGMGVARAVDEARAAGVDLFVEGTGRAVHQEPPPGLAPPGVTVRVWFAAPHETPLEPAGVERVVPPR